MDDGIATGFTVQAALRSLRRQQPGALVLATPVAPPDTLARLRPDADEIVCLLAPSDFHAVGQFYEDFRQTTDQEVIAALAHNRAQNGVPIEDGGGTSSKMAGYPSKMAGYPSKMAGYPSKMGRHKQAEAGMQRNTAGVAGCFEI